MHDATARWVNRLRHEVVAGRHAWNADVPPPAGEDAGPGPFDMLAAALATCASMTVRLYAERKSWPLHGVEVHVRHERTETRDLLHKTLKLSGPLDAEQRERLLEIAGKCPVHRVLAGGPQIVDTLAE